MGLNRFMVIIMILRKKYSLFLILLLLSLTFTSLVNNNKALGETNELIDNESVTDLSLVDQPSENLNLVDNSTLLQWSTYLGGSASDEGYSLAIDSQDNAIITGFTWSVNFPVLNGYNETHSGGDYDQEDVFISKFDSSGKMIWSTFFGGLDTDEAYSVAIDSQDAVIITGSTHSENFPVLNGFDETVNGGRSDAFLSKFDSSGVLVWSTYFGGSERDKGYSVAIDSQDNIIVTGETSSNNFYTLNGYDQTFNGGNTDAFISKFNSSGSLIWSSFFGGENRDYAESVAVDTQDNIIVFGNSEFVDPDSTNYEESSENFDTFITKFTSSGEFVWNTFLGGSSAEFGHSVAVNSLDEVIIAGLTGSNNFPVLNGNDESFNGGYYDGFLTKLSTDGGLIWSTFLGGKKGGDSINSVAINSQDAIIVTGYTDSSDFPTLGGFDESINGNPLFGDTFISKFNSSGKLVWSTYLGGSSYENSHSVAVDSKDEIIVTGITSSSDFPIFNAYDELYSGIDFDGDVFITKMLNPLDYTLDSYDSKITFVLVLFAIGSITVAIIIYRRKQSV